MTQVELADRVGVTRGYVAGIEMGRANPTLDVVAKIAAALDLEVDWLIRPPIIHDADQTGDLVHARCSAYVDHRLRAVGLLTAREVEIIHARSHGWIDLLAFDPDIATLLLVEVKTRLDDLGALERQIGWYERSALAAAHRLGWRPVRVVTWLVVLASAEADAGIHAHRPVFDQAFPVRAHEALRWLADGGLPPLGRVLAMVDPASRRRDWLIRTRSDGRRSEPPYRDLREAAQRLGS